MWPVYVSGSQAARLSASKLVGWQLIYSGACEGDRTFNDHEKTPESCWWLQVAINFCKKNMPHQPGLSFAVLDSCELALKTAAWDAVVDKVRLAGLLLSSVVATADSNQTGKQLHPGCSLAQVQAGMSIASQVTFPMHCTAGKGQYSLIK